MKKTWPKPPKPEDGNVCGGFSVGTPNEIPMFDRGKSGMAPSWETPRLEPAICKHGKGSCEACGTTNRRDVAHTTEGGRGAVARLQNRHR